MPTPQPAKEGVRPSTAPQCDDRAASLTKRPVPPMDYAIELGELLPRALREQKRFVVFDVGPPDPETGRLSKKPMRAGSDRSFAKSDDPATWVTFDEAADDGRPIGLAVGKKLAAVDLDDAFVDGELQPWAKQIIDDLGSYTERSISGKGLHVLLRITDIPPELINATGNPTFCIYDATLLDPECEVKWRSTLALTS